MFSKNIYETTLTSEVAGRLFSNVIATNALDQSFLATLRALLHRRLPQNESVQLTCTKVFRTMQEFDYGTPADVFSWILPDAVNYPVPFAHGIHIIHTAYPEVGEKMMEIVRANAGRRYLTNYK